MLYRKRALTLRSAILMTLGSFSVNHLNPKTLRMLKNYYLEFVFVTKPQRGKLSSKKILGFYAFLFWESQFWFELLE